MAILPPEEDVDAIRADIRAQLADLPERYRIAARDRYVSDGGDLRKMLRDAEREALAAIERVVKRATLTDQWKAARADVFERDRAICYVCGEHIGWDNYECGHIIDRMEGGTDRPSNLVCMCVRCNRLKPIHDTRAAFVAWIENGAWFAEIIEKLEAQQAPPVDASATLEVSRCGSSAIASANQAHRGFRPRN